MQPSQSLIYNSFSLIAWYKYTPKKLQKKYNKVILVKKCIANIRTRLFYRQNTHIEAGRGKWQEIGSLMTTKKDDLSKKNKKNTVCKT
jgi:hypothetical protein